MRPGLKAVPASESGPSLLVHVSTAEIGGAETSLLETLSHAPGSPVFLLPAEGAFSRELSRRGLAWRILPWPRGLEASRQGGWHLLPAALPGLPRYILRLHQAFREADRVWSSGFKSHCACLLLAPWHGQRLCFDVRDFLRPPWMRRLLALATGRFGSQVRANSAAVAADYPGAVVAYPPVRLPREAAPQRAGGGRRVITHLAYFAPYKGQDLFLEYARALLDGGLDAEFWLAGDVIYPAASHARYREKVYALAARLGLATRVRFLGRLEGAAAVQDLLERTDLLLHCTREPEPFGRCVMEALLCGAEAVCHRGSGVCELTELTRVFPGWMEPFGRIVGEEYVRVALQAPRVNPGAPSS